MKEIDNFIKYSTLFSIYKSLFSGKQKMYLEAFLEEDNSFTEIAQALQVSRQAVFDNIKRACKKLDFYEKHLNILENEMKYIENLKGLKKEFTIDNLDRLINELEGNDV